MSSSDFFKKAPKKEPAQKDESLFSPAMQKKRHDAALEFLKIFQEKIPLIDGKPHAGTVLSIPARLAGSSLYRALNPKKDIAPGTVVLSEEVNEAWPQLLNLFAVYCKQNGIDVMAKPLVTEFPEKDQPRMEVEQVLAEYQDQFHEIMKKHGLDYLNGARAGMVICSMVFQYHYKTVKDIDPYVVTGIIAMGVVEGAKTAPPPLGSRPSTTGAQEHKVKNNRRLVLGEPESAAREAHEHGGVFIDINPQVMKTLQAGNVDPYLIYERAMLNQIEEKIPRIDFVKANVDKLFDEWRSKSSTQAPVHVRLIIWLKNNAGRYGYEQQENSWVLKQ